jgi:CheY-like chemotaxis protein
MIPARRVLVVEDDPDIRDLVAQLLVGEGFAVETAMHGDEGLAKAQRQCPDVVILDLMMPVMSGPEFIALWQADSMTQRIPIVVVSAAYSPTTAEAVGVQAFLTKPFDVDRLLGVLKALLDEQG